MMALSGSRRLALPYRTLRRGALQLTCLSNASRLRGDCPHSAQSQPCKQNGHAKRQEVNAVEDNEDEEWKNVDIDMELDPVDIKKLALPLHAMETIPPDIISNILAKDKTIVFSPTRKRMDVCRRLRRMKYRCSVQPLGKVLHFRFFSLEGPVNGRGAAKDITPECLQRIKAVLRTYTRFIVTDDQWPLELSLEVTPLMQQQEPHLQSELEVAEKLSCVLSKELCVGAWCGISSTPILAKMACDAGQREHTLKSKDFLTGGIVYINQYSLPTHESLEKFMADLPVSAIPVVGAAQVKLLKDVYGITKCGEIAEQEERLGYSLCPATTEYFLSIAYGTMRLRGEIATTLLRKASRCKTAQIRRESQYGRVVPEEQFIGTVMTIFDTVYKDLIMHDFVCGRVSLETRRTVPRVFWVTEEYEDLGTRTNDRDLLREVVLRLAKQFAPRRTKELLDVYSICVHFADIRSWTEEHEGADVGSMCGRGRGRGRRKLETPASPEEKKRRMYARSPQARKKTEANEPRGIMVVM
ncbi:hypothetical protein DQ04_04621030 [Trypanosoma grayi]|uniref:hypothetical protein n=1 Tax=Trypanosoma grayi TaxID=71804 RepID=UPI0004F41819|nr:hypothetical protein DQ04_04621030 [Trypanosoma grayi]KEG09798.1 hypothetical protein DQ04_04621030 [Trypanosoma grayi]